MSEKETQYYIPQELKERLLRPILRFEPKSAGQRAQEKKRAEEDAIANAEPGDMIEGQGVFLGKYAPKDRDGVSLGKIFNVFAPPEDLPKIMTYENTVKCVASLKGWHGFNGTNYDTDKEIYAALKDGSYNGGWIIPTNEILRGCDFDLKETTPDNLFAYQNKGAFKGTFKKAAKNVKSNRPVFRGSYWSSTEALGTSLYVLSCRFTDDFGKWVFKDDFRMSCRPVRLVEIKSPR